jgi:hypothetical protein
MGNGTIPFIEHNRTQRMNYPLRSTFSISQNPAERNDCIICQMSKKLLVGAENNIVYFAAEWCFYIFAAKFSYYGNNYWQKIRD